MPDLVECRSEVEYAEKPVAVFWQGVRLEIAEILAWWRTPQGKSFRVRTHSGHSFELSYDSSKDSWHIEEK